MKNDNESYLKYIKLSCWKELNNYAVQVKMVLWFGQNLGIVNLGLNNYAVHQMLDFLLYCSIAILKIFAKILSGYLDALSELTKSNDDSTSVVSNDKTDEITAQNVGLSTIPDIFANCMCFVPLNYYKVFCCR